MQGHKMIGQAQARVLALGMLLTATSVAFASEGNVPNTTASIDAGRALFANMCTACHGANGKAQVDVVSDATDLTEPLLYRNGSTDADIFKSIQKGAGTGMPAFGAAFKSEAEIGNLRNFIKSLWPAAQRPPVTK
ncbi:MAG: c-type cytochrome [Pseudomonadota bacterium]